MFHRGQGEQCLSSSRDQVHISIAVCFPLSGCGNLYVCIICDSHVFQRTLDSVDRSHMDG